jgi:hypothetical protein
MAVEKSGYTFPNKIAHIYVKAIEQTLGSQAMHKVLELAGVPENQVPPPNNFARDFDFAYFGALGAALEKLYGPRGERGLTLHAGRVSFSGGLAEYGPILGVSELAFKMMPMQAKMKIILKAVTEVFTKFSDQITVVEETDDHFIYTIQRCPVCWGRTSSLPVCYSAIGIVEGALAWVSSGRSFRVEQVACHAMGDQYCILHIKKEPLD